MPRNSHSLFVFAGGPRSARIFDVVEVDRHTVARWVKQLNRILTA